MDILYEQYKYAFPDTMKEGDRLYIFTTGAYTQSYSSIGFNGFPPLKSYLINESKPLLLPFSQHKGVINVNERATHLITSH
jgi:hypothetical protein